MRKFLAIAALFLAFLAGWYLFSPRWTLREMKIAANAGDAQALSTYIDFPALRADLKAKLDTRLSEGLEGPAEEDRPLRPLGAAIGLLFAGPLIDRLLTPEGLAAIFATRAATGEKPAGGFKAKDMTIRRRGIDEFLLHDPAEPPEAGNLIFRRHGLEWRLSGIDLPARDPPPRA
ncbi:DUF2939 domain-containing protein [Flavisphingomonas formosensis]|uniref:DUF2939 domain-containing protein n=1 Tax=Flavisphingomonas formosensis TaxID=861534 RepID=UPI0012F79692|nr:DUF2939 domain-containing protein [Sphingomonas formosensis]